MLQRPFMFLLIYLFIYFVHCVFYNFPASMCVKTAISQQWIMEFAIITIITAIFRKYNQLTY